MTGIRRLAPAEVHHAVGAAHRRGRTMSVRSVSSIGPYRVSVICSARVMDGSTRRGDGVNKPVPIFTVSPRQKPGSQLTAPKIQDQHDAPRSWAAKYQDGHELQGLR